MKKLMIWCILLFLYACNKKNIYECVCYQTNNPSNYTKYVVKNTHTNAYNNCKALTDNSKNCFLTE